MPYRRPDSPYWWISYTDPQTGRQTRRVAGDNHAAAKAEEQALRAAAHAEQQRARVDVPLDTVLAEYLSARLDARTRATARHLTALAHHWCGDLTPAVVRAYITSREADGVKPGTINKELVMLSAAINAWNRDHDASLRNPVGGLKLREPEGRLRWLTRNEYAHLLAECRGDALRDFVELAVNTGMRRGELLNLLWTRVDFASRLIRLEADDTKTARPRAIPLNPAALAALERRAAACQNAWVFCSARTDGPIADFKRSFATACRRAGLTDVTPHTLRHTAASWMVQAGIPLYEVAKLLGHSSVSVTHRYSHLAPDHLRAAVDALHGERDNPVITAKPLHAKSVG